jgi:hypothetical protein
MKQQLRIAVHVVLLVVCSAFSARACDICGAFIGVTPYDNQSGFSFYHRYGLFSHIAAIQDQPLVPQGAYRIQPSLSVQHTNNDSAGLQKGDFESYKILELRGKWFVHKRVELNASVPFVMNRNLENASLEKVSGFGDLACWIGFHVFRSIDSTIRQRLVIGAGIKFPTGRNDFADEDGSRYHLYSQPGTGSLDETAYIQYSVAVRKIGSALNVTAKHNGENKYGEQIEPSYTSALNFFYMMKKGKTVFLPQLQFYAECTSGYTANNVYESGSDVGMVLGGLGCDAYFGRVGIHFTAQVPLAQIESQNSPGATFRGALGVSWNINQQKYLLN